MEDKQRRKEWGEALLLSRASWVGKSFSRFWSSLGVIFHRRFSSSRRISRSGSLLSARGSKFAFFRGDNLFWWLLNLCFLSIPPLLTRRFGDSGLELAPRALDGNFGTCANRLSLDIFIVNGPGKLYRTLFPYTSNACKPICAAAFFELKASE